MATRREKIEAMLADDPKDNFLRYSLALELIKESQHDRCLALFTELTKEDKPFVPAFFMAAQHLVTLDRINEARDFLRSGIEEARRQGDSHAAGEMGQLLATLGAAGE